MTKESKPLREFGNCRLDVEKKFLWCNDQPVQLPLKAIELLCVLVESGGTVVTKDEIWQAVWQNSFVEETNLTHNIYLLRKTFKSLGEPNLIQTVPSRGYRFAGEVREIEAGDLILEKHTLTRTTIEIQEGVNGIAVLPFVNLSADAEDDFFCDGLAEELLNTLAKIENLKVAARTSSFSFKNKNVNVGEIGRALNVNLVLEGSVGRVGNRLRIMVQLVDTANGFHLWSERFDREIKDIFDVQDEITLAIVAALKVKLRVEEKSALFKRYTDNTEVYELYLKGRFHTNRHTNEDLQKAIAYFKQVIEKESEYAPAYAGIAQCLIILWFFGAAAPHEIVPQWRAMANRALEIDGSLPEARYILASTYFYYDWNLAEAEKEYLQAIKIKPNSPDPYWRLGLLLASVGRFDEAVEVGERAVELDPLSLLVNLYVGFIYWFANRQDEASAQAQKIIEIEPRFFGAYWLLGAIHKARGEYEESVEQLQKAVKLGGNQTVLSILGDVYGLMGKQNEALVILNQLLEMRERQYVSAYDIARIYSGMGETDKAFEWMEKAVAERSGELVFLEAETKVGAGFVRDKAFREDSRLSQLLSKYFPRPLPATKTETQKHLVSDSISSKNRRVSAFLRFRTAAIAAILILLFAASFAFWRYDRKNSQTSGIKSIAVLPFKTIDSNKENEHHGLGLADILITRLSNIKELNVRPTSAIFNLENQDLASVGEKLKVDAILEGTIYRINDKIRVTARLIRTSDNSLVWAGQFEKPQQDELKLQDEIALQVVDALALNLSGNEKNALTKRYTESADALQLYIKGRYEWNKRSYAGMYEAERLFRNAIEKDPNFALAYIGLADRLVTTVDAGEASTLIAKALELDPNLAEAYATSGFLSTFHEWNWQDAEVHFKKSIELNPGYATAHHWYATLLAIQGRTDEAKSEMRRALEINPLSHNFLADLGQLHYFAREYDKAEEYCRKALEIYPDFEFAHDYLSDIYLLTGEYDKAVDEHLEFRQILTTFAGQTDKQKESGLKSFAKDRAIYQQGGIRKYMEYLMLLSSRSPNNFYSNAMIHTFLGDKEKALDNLEKAYESNAFMLVFVKADPIFDSLRSEPRYQEILRKMNL